MLPRRFASTIGAILSIGAANVFGCSGSSDDQPTSNAQAIDGVSCDRVVLEASRRYAPKDWTSGQTTLGGSIVFALPAEIPVVSGAPGNHKAILTLDSGSRSIECVYKGNGFPNHDDTDDDDDDSGHGGTAYVLKKCKGKDGKHLAAGSSVTAGSFQLHVKNGDRHHGTTTVRLVIDEMRPCDAVTRGEVGFHDRALAGLGGNGRACSDCHLPSDHFQLSPSSAEARYQALQTARATDPDADDPLFRAIDADDFRTNGNSASDFRNLRTNALVRIAIPLPPNVKLIDPLTGLPSSETAADVWRAVPTIENVKLSGPDGLAPAWPRGPNAMGGYQFDARVDTLQNQALGALIAHAQITVFPPPSFLDDMAAFQNTQFSSPAVKARADAIAAGTTPLPDIDPVLSPLEQAGKIVFQRACAQCHGGAVGSTPIQQTFGGRTLVRYFGISVDCPRPVDTPPAGVAPRFAFVSCDAGKPLERLAPNVRTYELTCDTPTTCVTNPPTPVPPVGTKRLITTSDPGRMLLSGHFGDVGVFDTTQLRGVGNTAPYFHNNSALTLEEVVIHYEEFYKRIKVLNPGVPLPILTTDGINQDRPNVPSERAALVAYLLKI